MGSGRVRVGLVGYGYAGRTFHAPLIDASPGLELVAVASRDAPAVRSQRPGLRVHGDVQALLGDDEVELVVVAAPNAAHFSLARAALEAGRHVVVDKPFTVALEDARALARLAKERGRVLSVFHNRRWDGDFLTLQALLERRALGRLVSLESRFDRFRPEVRARWREGSDPGSGLWYDLGPHLVDQALRLFGWPQAIRLERFALRDRAVADDAFVARLHYERLVVTLQAGTLVAAPSPRLRFAAQGTGGGFACWGLDPQEDALREGRRPGDSSAVPWGHAEGEGVLATADANGEPVPRACPIAAGNYPAYYAQLAEAVRGRAPNPVPPHEAVDVMALLWAGIESDLEGRPLGCGPWKSEAGEG